MPTVFHEYTANLHVHTTYSDGTGSIVQVIEEARKAGLDLLLINDHDTMAAREQGYEGFHDRLLVLVGFETSGPYNHLLAYGVETRPDYRMEEPQALIDRVREAGGVSFLAHPFEKGSPVYDEGWAYVWKDWAVKDFTGLCLWNYTSAWKELAVSRGTAAWHYLSRTGTLPGPNSETLSKWDELGLQRRVSAIAGSDAHAAIVKVLGFLKFRIFPYGSLFRGVNTHILLPRPLTGRLDEDRAAVVNALAEGRCYLAHDRLRSGKGFDFRLENSGELRAVQGGETSLRPGDYLSWRLPKRASARLFRDGRIILEMTAEVGRMEINSPGVYRLEVDWFKRFFGPRPWIFSNPVYVRE